MTTPPDIEHVVERFDHVAIAVKDPSSIEPMLALFGAVPFDEGYEEQSDFHWSQYDLPHWGRLEVISTDSADPQHFINRFVEDRGEGLHHLTFKVADLDASCHAAEAAGYRVVGRDLSQPQWKEAFLHPKATHGVLIQLAEFDDR